MSVMKSIVFDVQDAIIEGQKPYDEIAALFGILREEVEMIADELAEQDINDETSDAEALASAGMGVDEDYVHDNDYFDDYDFAS